MPLKQVQAALSVAFIAGARDVFCLLCFLPDIDAFAPHPVLTRSTAHCFSCTLVSCTVQDAQYISWGLEPPSTSAGVWSRPSLQ